MLHVHEGPAYLTDVELTSPGLIAREPDGYVVVAEWIGEYLRGELGVPPEAISVVRPPVGDEYPVRAAATRGRGVRAGPIS